jgi:hypothetical protein
MRAKTSRGHYLGVVFERSRRESLATSVTITNSAELCAVLEVAGLGPQHQAYPAFSI